ncbi:hypothetical protein UlMin_024698 [Ulmus minor]
MSRLCLPSFHTLDFFSLHQFVLIRNFLYCYWFLCELRQTAIQEMENNQDCNDKQRIQYLISEGLERLKRLDEMLDMQGH